MALTLKLLVAFGLKLTITSLMISLGLQTQRKSLSLLWQNKRLLAGSLIAAFIVVPVVAYIVIQTLPLSLATKAGLWVVAITPGAPLTYNAASRRVLGNPDLAASFQVTAATLVIVMAPLWLAITSLLTRSNYWMNPLLIMKEVLIVQLIPIVVGLIIHHYRPELAERIGRAIGRVGFVVIAGLVLLVLIAIGPDIIGSIQAWEFLATAIVAVSALAGGHYLAGPDPISRATIANANTQRNAGLALTIAAWNLPEQKSATLLAIIVYVLVAAVIVTVYTKVMLHSISSLGGED